MCELRDISIPTFPFKLSKMLNFMNGTLLLKPKYIEDIFVTSRRRKCNQNKKKSITTIDRRLNQDLLDLILKCHHYHHHHHQNRWGRLYLFCFFN